MNIFEIILIGLSLSLDAMTISICYALKSSQIKIGLITTVSFSIFQFIMPIIGFYFGNIISNQIINYHSYLSSIILIVIGILQIKEEKINEVNNQLKFSELFFLSIATSIDALAIGISFSFLETNIFISSIIIGFVTFIMCSLGFYLGKLFNKKAHQYAGVIGGITLIIIGIKHLF